MKFGAVFVLVLSVALGGRADLLLQDNYDNNSLETFDPSDIRGGFNGQSSSGTPGIIAVESGTVAQISNASNQNDFRGILSNQASGWSTAGGNDHTLVTTWHISSSVLKDKASSMMLTWQTDPNLTTTAEIGVMLDLNNSTAYLFSGSTNNNLGFEVSLDAAFGDPGQAFTITVTFTDATFNVQASDGVFADNETNLFGSWANSNIANVFSGRSSSADYYLGAFVQAKGTNGLVVDVDYTTMEAIPEPAILGLIGLFGGGIIMIRRIFDL